MQIKNILIIVFFLFFNTALYATPWYYFEISNHTNLTLNLTKIGQKCIHKGKYSMLKSIAPNQSITIKYDQDSTGGSCDENSKLVVKINSPNGKDNCVLNLGHHKSHPHIIPLLQRSKSDYLFITPNKGCEVAVATIFSAGPPVTYLKNSYW